MEAQIESISPNKAAMILKKNTINRPLSPKRVKAIADQIINGKWVLNGEAIIIAETGRLLDGQHRLEAIATSGKTVKSLIVRGVNEIAFETIDTGAARRPRDVLAIHGEKNSTVLAGGIRLIKNLEELYSRNGLVWQTIPFPNSEYQRFVEENPEIRDWAVVPTMLRKFYHSAIYCGLGFLFSRHNAVAARDFFEQLASGAGLEPGSPVLLLRNTVMATNVDVKFVQVKLVAITIIAFNAFLNGRKAKTKRLFDYEKFPRIGDKQ